MEPRGGYTLSAGSICERRGESGAEACAVPPRKRGDDQGVGEYRGQRRKPLPFCGELCCYAGGQQCGKRAADDIRRAVRTQQICDQAPNKKPPLGFREEEGEHAQRFGYPALNRAVGDAEERGGEGQHCIQSADHGGQC